ncbi:hypothetical protein OAK01_06450 [Candidatus Nitrosopelagicus sp.]|nr:hypothetical protein [Candidatus Nitrosopelagicus sp.]
MNEPLVANNDGVNVKPELMEKEKLYHCIFNEKVILAYKDHQDFLNCYEIEEIDLVQKIKSNVDQNIDSILEDYMEKTNLKSK